MSYSIALVDDDRNILTSISMALENEGFKVQAYIDAENALIGISRNPPDLATSISSSKSPSSLSWWMSLFEVVGNVSIRFRRAFSITSGHP